MRIGDKTSVAQRIHQSTKIPTKALTGKMPLNMFSVEEKFGWTKNRQTMLPEDMAYCLVGIVNVRMTPVYADGDRDEQGYKAVKELKRLIKKNPASMSHSVLERSLSTPRFQITRTRPRDSKIRKLATVTRSTTFAHEALRDVGQCWQQNEGAVQQIRRAL
jgi:hypothetical protein